MLVGSLALAVGLAIYDLTIRELDLSAVATQSQYAVYAADTGAECALYWDTKCPLGSCVVNSTFATSSNTNGNFAVLVYKASAEMTGPGAITPPTYSCRAVTQSNVVAVPKSSTIAGP